MTKVHQLFPSRSTYSPDRLKVLGDAFDHAWQSLAGNFGNVPTDIDAARTTLATIILNLPSSEHDDADRIKNAAVHVMAVGYRNGRQAIRKRMAERPQS
jgi:DNA-binding transcriptional regulator YbjK